MENNYCNLDTRKLLSLEGQTWSHFDYGIDEDSSSNDIEDGKSDTSSTILPTTNGGITYNSFGVSDTMKLKEEDMYLFGICPAYDPFFLAVCEYCGQVIKPQALAKHIEMRHRSFPSNSKHAKMDNLSHGQLNESCNAQSSINLIPGMKGVSHRVGANGDTMNTHASVSSSVRSNLFSSDKNDSNKHLLSEAILPGPGSSSSSPLSFGHHHNNQSNIPGSGHLKNSSSLLNQSGINSPFNNIPVLGSSSSAASSPNSSNSSQTLLGSNNNLLTNSRYVSSSQIIANKTDLNSGESSNLNTVGSNGAKTKSSTNNLLVKKASVRGKLLLCKDREYDADKHCGVKIGDMDKPCTRSLTCKTHSLTLRRSVTDRSKNFDDLLIEHRATKEAALRAAGIEVKPTKQQLKQRELEAKRQLLLQQQQQQQKSQQQQKQQKQQHTQLLQQKLDQSNSHQQQLSKSQSKQQYNPQHHQQSHHLRHHSNHSQEIPQPVSSHSHHHNNQQLKEKMSISQCNQNLTIGRQDKQSPILARQLNETIEEIKSDLKSSTPPPPQPPISTTLPSSSPVSTNQLEKPNFIEVDGCLYLPNPPKPMALCNFNARQISIEPLNCDHDEDNPCNLSSRLFNRKRDLTYSALTIFRAQSKTDGSSRPRNQKLLSLLNSN